VGEAQLAKLQEEETQDGQCSGMWNLSAGGAATASGPARGQAR
jgi:hypothetical protein